MSSISPMSFSRIVVLLLVPLLYRSSVAFDYTLNGANWDTGQCAKGAGIQQSPIDIPHSISEKGESTMFLKYPEISSSFPLYHNGYSIAFTLPDGYRGGFGLGANADDFKTDGASAYRLWQVNFHAPSEHSFDGQKMPLEMQLMHKRVTGGGPETAVVVVFFADAANVYNDFLETFAQNLPDSAWSNEKNIKLLGGMPLASIIGGSPFYHYTGSLTVPPCPSNVAYYLRQAPINAANAQLAKFTEVMAKTCPPKGNFRVLQPNNLASSIVLLSSVDLVTNPSVTVKPAEPKDNIEKLTTGTGPGCEAAEYDKLYEDAGRITVGDPDYVVEAKTNYIKAKRGVQAADGTYRTTQRNADMQQGLYENAPGLVEKINLKWNVVNAKTMAAAAQVNRNNMAGTADEPEAQLKIALNRMCDEEREAAAKEQKTSAKTPTPAQAPVQKINYPEPHVTLPQGLDASPFTDGAKSSFSLGGTKVAPNLQQADVPPASSIKRAESKSGVTVEDALPEPKEREIKILLPINPTSVVDGNKFQSDLVDALAKTAKVPPSTLKIQGVTGKSVPNVQSAPPPQLALFQLQTKRNFLRSISS